MWCERLKTKENGGRSVYQEEKTKKEKNTSRLTGFHRHSNSSIYRYRGNGNPNRRRVITTTSPPRPRPNLLMLMLLKFSN